MRLEIEKEQITAPRQEVAAPGRPGNAPHWSNGAKTGVGATVAPHSRVWFTFSQGILNEIYFPSIDEANTREIQFLVSDGKSFLSEEKTGTEHEVAAIADGVPGFRITNTCKQGRYRITKTLIGDPERDALLQRIQFAPTRGNEGLRLYLVIDPHMGDEGADNNAWIGEYKGIPMLFAGRGDVAMAVACSAKFSRASCGFMGESDGYTDLQRHKNMTWSYNSASNGNVGLAAEIDWNGAAGEFTLALGFGADAAEAGQQARAGLLQRFDDVARQYIESWKSVQSHCLDLAPAGATAASVYRTSIGVLRVHESKRFAGGIVASLSIPWGFDRGDSDAAGYHVLWPRDMVQGAMGWLAAGNTAAARRTFFFLQCTQEHEGRWTQNMWLDGTPRWTATQMDGTGFAILLADSLRRMNELREASAWPTIREAARFLARNGPITQQDRWEENSGYSPYTMAVEVAALLAAADFAEQYDERDIADFLRSTADAWNDSIDEWTYAEGTPLAREHRVAGYYVRIAPQQIIHAGSLSEVEITIKNRRDRATKSAADVVSPDALGLVRFGLRSAGDPRIRDTVKILDATLKSKTKTGPVWHRYTGDGYGEREDGSPFQNTGVGRGWPLLAGERAHYELALGNMEQAQALVDTMAAQTSECGLIPEQVWDAADIPERELFNGHPTGSGMPLVWAHAEYVKLLRSIQDRRVWDTPPQTVRRYQEQPQTAPFVIWTPRQQRRFIPAGKDLRIDLPHPATVHWSADGWKTVHDTNTGDSKIGVHFAILSAGQLKAASRIVFTWRWREGERWEGFDYEVEVH